MKNQSEPFPWVRELQELLKEVRCANHPEHRIQAVQLLLEQDESLERNTFLINAALYDPDEQTKDRIIRLLYDAFGKKLYDMLDAEKSNGIPIVTPWLTGCTAPEPRQVTGSDQPVKEIQFLSFESLLKEIRCESAAIHRIAAAKRLVGFTDYAQRIAYLINVVLYDPDLEVKRSVKAMLADLYGNDLENIIKIEASDGQPIETPWMLPCRLTLQTIDLVVDPKRQADKRSQPLSIELEELYDALRDPADASRRLAAAKALARNHTEENLAMLANAVLFDPDENVQQQAYQSLYEAAGDDKAEMMVNAIAAETEDQEVSWLLEPEFMEDTLESAGNDSSSSLFGLNKADEIRGMINLFHGEHDPQKRIAILKALAQSSDVTVNEAIARVGLFDDSLRVREYARAELQNRLGDHLEDFLAHIYDTTSSKYPDPEEEIETDEPQTAPVEEVYLADDYSEQLRTQSPVIEEGRNFSPLIILSGIIIVSMILYLIFK